MVKDSVVNFKDPKLTKELNLIENNRRSITVPILLKVASLFNIELYENISEVIPSYQPIDSS